MSQRCVCPGAPHATPHAGVEMLMPGPRRCMVISDSKKEQLNISFSRQPLHLELRFNTRSNTFKNQLICFMRWWWYVLQGMTVDRAMLRGEALVEGGSGAEEVITALSIASLPTDPCARFARLFALRPRWALPELEPYLADLQVCPVLMSGVEGSTPHVSPIPG